MGSGMFNQTPMGGMEKFQQTNGGGQKENDGMCNLMGRITEYGQMMQGGDMTDQIINSGSKDNYIQTQELEIFLNGGG